MITDVYLEPRHTSMMVFFCILTAFNRFYKKSSSQMFDWVLNELLQFQFLKAPALTHLFPMYPFSNLLRFSDVFRDQRKGALGTNRLRNSVIRISTLNACRHYLMGTSFKQEGNIFGKSVDIQYLGSFIINDDTQI